MRRIRLHNHRTNSSIPKRNFSRLAIFQIGILLGFSFLFIRLFYWQIIKGKSLSAQARGQYEYKSEITAWRGGILDSNGSWLTTSKEAWTVAFAIPEMTEDKKKVADLLAPFFVRREVFEEESHFASATRDESDRLYALLTRDKIVWAPLKSRVTDDTKKKIEEFNLEGIHFEPEEVRQYPESSSAAQLLGFVGKDKDGNNKGYFGLEGYYDTSLTGKPGYVSREADPWGAPIFLGESREVTAISGVDLATHIDTAVQITLEKRLSDGISKYGAKGGTVIIMDPKTGAIYGMASNPSYDPGAYWDYGDTFFSNPAVSSTFEPGSIFKVLVMAGGLDAGVITPQTECDICNGPLKIDKYLIETWNREYTANSTMTNVIVHSDNVGMVFVAKRLGIDKLYNYIKAFGIGESTGIDLQGEAVAALRKREEWGPVEQATASFGQGVAVSPIQMVRAVGAIANEGVLVTPQVVDKFIGGAWEKKIEPVVGKQVISSKAAHEITQMMAEAAKNGESKWTYLRGFRVAGKTGTAQIALGGTYDETNTNASFIGFAPYDDPKFVMLVILNQPQTSQWASETAAPLWYSIAKDLFLHFGVQPEEQKE